MHDLIPRLSADPVLDVAGTVEADPPLFTEAPLTFEPWGVVHGRTRSSCERLDKEEAHIPRQRNSFRTQLWADSRPGPPSDMP